ncbi:branched-chain amino acid ABC transporter permease [Tateyamaria sp.]|uniref:branched-chain amino acid ABC transporter permease n=1 Tax=Tateyamaria sp. TaxID=1929288 RepID=UPI00329D5DCB
MRLKEPHINALVLFGLLAIPLFALVTDEPFTITLVTRAVILALAAVGLNIILGIGGLVSFGHALFFGIGGYAMGILAHHAQTYTALDLGFFSTSGTKFMPIIWVVAMLVSAGVAYVIGLLTLRTSGVYFIMITLAFAQMFYYFAISWPQYGGEDGLSIYVRNDFPGLNTLVPIQFFGICFVILCIVLFLNARLQASPFGLALNATRQTPTRVEAVGLNPMKLKLLAFVISGAITGLAGALFADLNRFVSPTMFNWHLSGELIVLIVIGGVGRLMGPVIGACVFVALEYFLGGLTEFWHIYLGLILLCIVLFGRGGILGLLTGKEGANV